jgi:acetate kinase
MNVLAFNCGSSSLKYRLIEMPAAHSMELRAALSNVEGAARELAGGEAQRVGPRTAEPSRISHHALGRAESLVVEMPDHAAAFEQVMRLLARDPALRPDAVGHRLVHGGEQFRENAILDARNMADLEKIAPLAPLHNPPAIALIRACRERYPDLPQAAIFDTAFHSTIPDYARAYALPAAIRRGMGLRKYGFHGISHQYVCGEAARFLGVPLGRFNAVSCHLGSGGASLCAIVGGKSVDNTMGYSPLQGLLMSTRCGDLDPGVSMQLLARAGGDFGAVDRALNSRSGVLGLSGLSADIRDVLGRRASGDEDRRLDRASQVYLWRIRKYLGAYLAVVGTVHAVLFTDTIGECVPEVRFEVCAGMEAFGLRIDPARNAHPGPLPADVAAPDSDVRALVVATNEELAIARYTYEVVSGALQAPQHAAERFAAGQAAGAEKSR